jgi:hypothetical protein
MSDPVQFDYELPGGNMIEVNATVAPGRPERRPDLNHPGDPAEGPDIEINDCFLKDINGVLTDLPFDPDGLYIKNETDKFTVLTSFVRVTTDMEDYAWDAYSNR